MLKNLNQRGWLFWVTIGVVIRLFLMPITLHADLLGHSFTAYFLAYEGKLNPYQTLLELPPEHPLVRNFGVADIFIYPPLTYFTLGLFRILVKPFTDPNFLPFVMESPSAIYERSDLFLNLFLYKFPYLFIDLAIAFLLAGCFKEINKKRLAFILWMFNPITLYSTFMIGQIDVLSTLFTVFALYFAMRNKNILAVLSLGLGSSYKVYPLLLLIPLSLILGKSIRDKIKLMIIGLIPFILTLMPFINSYAFRYMVFSPKTSKALFMGWGVSGAEFIYPFILGLVIIYLDCYYSKIKLSFATYSIAVLLLLFSVTHYHPQWFLWPTPFLIWQQVRDNFKYFELVLIFVISWLVITFLFEPSLSFGLFNPIIPSLRESLGLSDILSKYLDVFQFKSIVRSLFAAASLFYVYKLFKNERLVG